MGRRPPTDEQVRAGGGWGVVGLIAVACTYVGLATDDGRLVAGGVAGLVAAGILGAFGGA